MSPFFKVIFGVGFIFHTTAVSAEVALKKGVKINEKIDISETLSPSAHSSTFQQEETQDFTLRALGQLRVSNLRGQVRIHGWPQDKIRVRVHKQVDAENETQAQEFFKQMSLRFEEQTKNSEIIALYGNGLDLLGKLRERRDPHSVMDLDIFAPGNLSLTVQGADQLIQISQWNSEEVVVRSRGGAIRLQDLKTKTLQVYCPSCIWDLKDVRAKRAEIKALKAEISVQNLEAETGYWEIKEGKLAIIGLKGEWDFNLTDADLKIDHWNGDIEFRSQNGPVELLNGKGSILGIAQTGVVHVDMGDWDPRDKTLIETSQGNIFVGLPNHISLDIFAETHKGLVNVGFPLLPQKPMNLAGVFLEKYRKPAEFFPNRARGRIGEAGGGQLYLQSQTGNISIQRRIQ